MKMKLLSVLVTFTFIFSLASVAFAQTKYQAENAILLGTNTKVEGDFVIGWDNPGEGLEFTVNAPSAGSYDLEVGYATPMVGSTFLLSVNGGPIREVPITTLSDWGQLAALKTKVTLQEGENKIRITKGKGFVQLDYIIVFD